MNVKKIKNLIKKQEGTKLDFKLKLALHLESNKKELAKDISAIANSRGGRGYIIVGVDDRKNIIGLKENEIIKEEQIQQIISSRCEPPIPITVETYLIDNEKISLITIYSSEHKPYQIRETGAFHIRRGSITDVMRRQELVENFEENLNFFTETSLIIRSDISNLNKELVEKYFIRKNIVLDGKNEEFLLESSGIAYKEREEGRICCTLGGLLVFSDDNSMFLPNNMIKIINKINKEIEEVIIIQGNILEMIDKSERTLEKIILIDYPKDAIIEAIKNAVLYRRYSSIDKVIEVIIGYKSIVIISPGSLIEKNTSNKFANNGKRNMWLYEKLITLDNNKRFLNNGQGFSRIKKSFTGKAYVKFINSLEEDSFKIILPGISNYNK